MEFTKTRKGYKTTATTAKGSTWTIEVAKREVMNSSVRGGAYREVWFAQFGSSTGRGDTREQAVFALAYNMEVRKGIVLTFEGDE
jgi:hypothetical protein